MDWTYNLPALICLGCILVLIDWEAEQEREEEYQEACNEARDEATGFLDWYDEEWLSDDEPPDHGVQNESRLDDD